VGATDYALEQHAGVGLFIQSPVLNLAQAQARFDKFKVEYKALLEALTPEVFEKIKAGILVTLSQSPKNMSEERLPIFSDWSKENWDYDSKVKLIGQVDKVSLEDIKSFYKATLANPNAARINIQLRGTNYQNKPFAKLPNQTVINDVSKRTAKITYQK
jgi:protease-3